eukprot:TRINITY_DN1750_c0_g2_i5.p1 TRINITY_DN1750_c0_g2~~TRINITY_DN1750_c0_g2_i5.p1  ORF type:complete len:214 (-),score=41.14 TRINITY_DN1750_c0_g2_i5:455-1096(-)
MTTTTNIARPSIDTSIFFCCDIQEKFRAPMHFFDAIIKSASFLFQVASVVSIPIIITEQVPDKLGSTVSELQETITQIKSKPNGDQLVQVFGKTKFSMLTEEVKHSLQSIDAEGKRKNVVLFGIETHVCILQTAFDLVDSGYNVHIICDGVCSINQDDRMIALRRLEQTGRVYLTTAESVVFQFLGSSTHPSFRELSTLVRTRKRVPSGLVSQ